MTRGLTITKLFEFEAAHQLHGYPGNCKHIHGHSYKVEVEVGPPIDIGPARPLPSMVMDLKMLSDIVKPIIKKLDHSFLNDLLVEPTAEILCIYIKDEVVRSFKDINLVRVRVWETSTGYAEWRK